MQPTISQRLYTLTGKRRTISANRKLGCILACCAGFINAGGFFIVQQYTSHMTGILSIAADNLVLEHYGMTLLMLGYVACFMAGACTTTVIVIKARRRALHSQYALPLLVEAILLLGIIALRLILDGSPVTIPLVIACLCFLMGLQNALITKASTAIIRTTHVTGMMTDLGIEIGRTLLAQQKEQAAINQRKASLHIAIIASFLTGGIIGAFTLAHFGVVGLLPIAILLIILCLPSLQRDLTVRRKWKRRITAAGSPYGSGSSRG